jgi:1-acyl-sn-glycerol-3-phosphate acyltransferase
MKNVFRSLMAVIFLPLVAFALLLSNVLQTLSLLVYPVSRAACRYLNRLISGSWFNFLRWSLEVPIGIRFVQTGDALPWRENAFLLANHQAMADIPSLLVIARKSGRLGDLKWFVKEPLKWVPGVGWGLQFLDSLFVKRNWTADKESVMAVFSKIRREKIPFWVISFLEGTRSSPKKIAKSQSFARKQGWPELKHVMLPRSRGFEATLEGLGALNQAIYDVTIAYPGAAPDLLQLFFGPVDTIHLHVRRFTEWPEKREERAEWVMERFREKDELLSFFKEHGRFPSA